MLLKFSVFLAIVIFTGFKIHGYKFAFIAVRTLPKNMVFIAEFNVTNVMLALCAAQVFAANILLRIKCLIPTCGQPTRKANRHTLNWLLATVALSRLFNAK